MQSAMPESLQNTKNDWMQIYRESGSAEELAMATYLRALENDCFSQYRPKVVYAPKGWHEAIQDYRMVAEENRAKVWKVIAEKFYGFIKAKDEAHAENDSNSKFLKEMFDFFTEKSMAIYAEKCRVALLQFQVEA